MPVVKGGVWTNIEDEILKAAVSKYGPNQWARVSSLLARKTPKQCKARWTEWLDPGIRKIEWSKEEDEKLLHLAKLMPTQWRSIAPIVGRTATQCLERYQKLLDEAEAKENDEMSLGGPAGGEAVAPSADDVRKLRPGELDPDPESKPARPDTVDLDEDEKEMLSEARARLANTQGKKAKRKARERQLEESRRLAVLQKRRELKNAGINIKVITRKPGQMDYNADIPFEKQPAPGFHDTQQELSRNQREKDMFDPRRQQLANKRKNGEDEGDSEDRKRRKNDGDQPSAASQAASKAGQMQKVREAERASKRKGLNLPAPQVGESEMEDIIKMGMSGQRAAQDAGGSENDNTKGLLSNYSSMVGSTPIRTPRAPQEEDRIANEVRNARARTETQSALLGGENTDMHEGAGTTGYEGVTPSKQTSATPNPMATPFRQGGVNGAGATPRGPGQTPMRTPRDNFRLNDQTPSAVQLAGQTPREIRQQKAARRNDLGAKLGSLPAPKETEWELEIPEEQEELGSNKVETEQDAAIRDQRNRDLREAAERAEFKRQTQVVQKYLPRPDAVDLNAMLQNAKSISDPAERALAEESARLIANDAAKFGNTAQVHREAALQNFSDEQLDRAKMEIALEAQTLGKPGAEEFSSTWNSLHSDTVVPGLAGYAEDEVDGDQLYTEAFDTMQSRLESLAASTTATEKKLAVHLGGYQQRQKSLRQQLAAAGEELAKVRVELETKRAAVFGEQGAVGARVEGLRAEVQAVLKREQAAQEVYRERLDELHSIGGSMVNGWH